MSEVETKYCPYCGTLVKPTDTFCPNCGAGLEPVASQPTTLTPSQVIQTATPVTTTQPSALQQDTMSIIAIIIGAISLAANFFFGPCGVVVSIIAIIIGFIAIAKEKRKGLAIGGIVLALIGIIMWVLLFLLVFGSISFFM